MPQNADTTSEEKPKSSRPKSQTGEASRQWITTPQPIRRLFDKFPLRTYPVNELPQRSPRTCDRNTLWILTTEKGAQLGVPSFNPGCLKWQVYLLFKGIDFVTIPSNNHASPTGALPFLLPASSSKNSGEAVLPVPSIRIERWLREKKTMGRPSDEVSEGRKQHAEATASAKLTSTYKESVDMRYEAYMSLLNCRIRNAYLYSLYLCPPNFASIVLPCYIKPSTSNTLARLALSHQLRAAAETELLKQSPIIDVEAIYRECHKAFEALSNLLGDDKYFFGEETPGLFDASVFAYTHVLLDENLDWKHTRITEGLEQNGNLVEHQKRIMEGWFGNNPQGRTGSHEGLK
ncbi:hypothetical protein IMSHALPRED_004233 [Imshaugia aleurites]|uniref:Metaxin n=1 Tax=Imshaugia aleurites TaxID=172621 RepID=A0A8H3F2Q7_9LECA|nr:hypothetical protein IMSHALPRED_004233 [Imshaugia aleurites]